ncbi:hypothetical protein BTO20_05900 [Mycobacterium dioxanotrophicus]|uniref:Uncharacterized protein n=1 Tax=Mycobacterium dioxanotrophicus TaxID=482462 RepID=A0A1Y0BZ24_9MYCO|nr:hypothetical protein [Mycobacterium dioxanotrophicus]ART68180.1 hypothetical protein BTO20_05900 [Mycobacterium dioxanotrophicus]
MSELDLDELENATRGLVYMSDGTRASEKLGRIVDAHRLLIAEVRRLRPTLIETVEQLDALPDRSIVHESHRDVAWMKDGRYTRNEPWWATGSEVEEPATAIVLPVRVLYTPELDR